MIEMTPPQLERLLRRVASDMSTGADADLLRSHIAAIAASARRTIWLVAVTLGALWVLTVVASILAITSQ